MFVQVCIFPLNMTDIIICVVWWWEKYLLKSSLIKHTCFWRDKRLIVINEIRQISRKKLDFAKFRKLQEAIWLTVINEIFKVPPRLGLFCQINYLFELFSSYPSYPIQKWYIWANFQTSRKRCRKSQEVLWLTVINEIFKVPPHFDSFCKVNYLYELSPGYPKYPIQKWNIWTSF